MILGTLFAALFGCGLLWSCQGDKPFPLIASLRHWSYDLPFYLPWLVGTKLSDVDAVIVYMDEDSYRVHQQNPLELWDRSLHVELMKRLKEHGARIVVFDIVFGDPWVDRAVDEAFARAIRDHGKVVLAADLGITNVPGYGPAPKLWPAISGLATNAVPGIYSCHADTDDVIRRQSAELPTLALQAARLAGKTIADPAQTRWMRFYGPTFTIPSVKYYQVLKERALPDGFFSNKVVFVGAGPIVMPSGAYTPLIGTGVALTPGTGPEPHRSRKGTSDDHRTPFSQIGGGRSPGVEVEATAYLNLVRHDWLTEVPLGIQLLVALFFAGFASRVLDSFARPGAVPPVSNEDHRLPTGAGLLSWRAFWTVVLLFLALVTIGCVLPLMTGWWLPWLVLAVPQFAFLVFWVLWVDLVLPFRNIPGYQLIRCIGSGSFGEVWFAKSTIGNRKVAIKFIVRRRFKHAGSGQNYETERDAVVRYLDAGLAGRGWVSVSTPFPGPRDQFFWYEMELADKASSPRRRYEPRTLYSEIERLRKTSASDDEVLRISLLSARILSEALEQLHRKGLVYRDIKADNIIFVDGEPKFADIGLIANAHSPGVAGTPAGAIVGRAPTQKEAGTAAADIYALGLVLHELSMGVRYPDANATRLAKPLFARFIDVVFMALSPLEGRSDDKTELDRIRFKTAAEMHRAFCELARDLGQL